MSVPDNTRRKVLFNIFGKISENLVEGLYPLCLFGVPIALFSDRV